MIKYMLNITSLANPRFKAMLKLKSARQRRLLGLILIEGRREIQRAVTAGWRLTDLFVTPQWAKVDSWKQLPVAQTYQLTPELMTKLSVKEHPDGLVAVAARRDFKLDDLKLSRRPLIIILEKVEKPGNLGAILRTAAAAGVDAIITNDQQTDLYNPNVLRASLGHIFTVPTVSANFDNTVAWLKKNNITGLAAAVPATANYTDCDLTQPTAIILGAEDTGLSEAWLKAADQLIKIPMRPTADSLNVSVAAAIIVYEAVRQRLKS